MAGTFSQVQARLASHTKSAPMEEEVDSETSIIGMFSSVVTKTRVSSE